MLRENLCFSPSIDIDKTWEPVKKYQSDTTRASEKGREKLYFDHYNPSELENIIETRHKIIKMMKAAKRTKLFSVLVGVGDFADDPIFTRQSKLLHSLFAGGRHNSISTIASTQNVASIHPIVRVDAVALIVYPLRNNKEVESFLEEVSGLTGKKELLHTVKEVLLETRTV